MAENKSVMDFSNIILSYAVNATIHLGLAPDPTSGKIETDLNRAKDLIDILTRQEILQMMNQRSWKKLYR